MKRWLELFWWFIGLIFTRTTSRSTQRWRNFSPVEWDRIAFGGFLAGIIVIILVMAICGSVIAEYQRYGL